MNAPAPDFPTKTIERICSGCGQSVTLSWRKGGNFGGRCSRATDVLGKDGKPAQCGTWVALTPAQSRALIAKDEKGTEHAAPPPPPPPPASEGKPARGKPKPAAEPAKPAADPPRAAAKSRYWFD